ncbi:DUF6404 family protein [Vibrio parahaemolyticus]|uniref:DUF6404 family protein n=1 Tax=Vibrio parahaemolyticus TaxID=670 RepID=UPI003B683AFC
MDKVVFIRQHLIEKGVPTDLVYSWPFLWAKLFKSKGKPLVFQSPIKLFVLDALYESVIWGGFMWFIVWHLRPEGWPIYVILSIAFGLSMGLVTAWRVHKAKKKLGPLGWGEWCKANYESAP